MPERTFEQSLREFQDRCQYFYMQLGGKYDWPNSKEGDLLRLMHNAIEKKKGRGK